MAFEAGAVPETLGGAGILIREKRLDEIAEMAHLLVRDSSLREKVVAGQDRALEAMDQRDDEGLLTGFIEQVIQMPSFAKVVKAERSGG